MPVVYIDVIWAVNLVLDTVMLLTTAWIAKYPISFKRLILGGFIGSLYSLLLFFPPLSLFTTWPGKAVVSLVMVAIALPCKSWIGLARAAILFYVVAFVFAGAALFMHFAVPGTSVGSGTVITGGRLAFVSSLSSLALLAAIPVAVAGIKYTIARVRIQRVRAGMTLTLSARVGQQEVSFTGLMDTGNQLRDPLSGRPVCLVDVDVCAPLLPKAMATAIAQGADVLTALAALSDEEAKMHFAVIPFRGAGGGTGLTVAFRPDELVICRPAGNQPCPPCLLAVNLKPLSKDKAFQAILHTDLITGDDMRNEKPVDATTQNEVSHPVSAAVDSHSRKDFRGL